MAGRMLSLVLVVVPCVAVPVSYADPDAAPGTDPGAHAVTQENADGSVIVDGQWFASWGAYFTSDTFRANGRRCAATVGTQGPLGGGGGEDCTLSFTNTDDVYDPAVAHYRIPVVVHVLRQDNGVTGHLSEEMVRSQIDILNEDFLALPGTNGEDGTDSQIEFFLATLDPEGNPTNGITYSDNTEWFNDDGNYWDVLAWDTNRYLNIYTNTASGALGYVPALPQSGIPGSNADRVVCHYRAFGRNSPWVPFHLGRTAVHEVGHYLGLFHTFSGGCSGDPCNARGDLICDTNPESNPHYGCSISFSCNSEDPIHNYMNYTNDSCMGEFTPDQARRARCTLEHYRPDLFEVGTGCAADLDGSGNVGFPDLLQLLSVWGPCEDCPEDLDASGDVGFPDLLALLSAWGPCVVPRPVDNCEDTPVAGDGAYPYTTLGASDDGPSLPPECDEGNGRTFRRDVWIRYVASCTGVATASICESDFNTRLAVYDVSACPGDVIACSDDACGEDGTRSETTFPVVQGEEYLVRIGGRTSTGSGTLILSCEAGAP